MSDLVERLRDRFNGLGPPTLLIFADAASEITRLRGQVEEGERRIAELERKYKGTSSFAADLMALVAEGDARERALKAERDTATLALSQAQKGEGNG